MIEFRRLLHQASRQRQLPGDSAVTPLIIFRSPELLLLHRTTTIILLLPSIPHHPTLPPC